MKCPACNDHFNPHCEMCQGTGQVGKLPVTQEKKVNMLEIRGCLLAESGHGDCEHYIGLPTTEDEKTTDEYGRPFGWCEVCWRGEIIHRLKQSLHEFAESYGGPMYANDIVTKATKR